VHRMPGTWISSLAQDLRYAVRGLRSSPGFTAVAVVSLAIGIGANTAVFSAARVALFDPLPVDAPDALRFVHWTSPDGLRVSQYNSSGGTDPASGRSLQSNYSWAGYRTLREVESLPADVFGFNFLTDLTVAIPGQAPVNAGGVMVSGNYFRALRPPMALGRGLSEQDDLPSATPAVVLSHQFWSAELAADPEVVGRLIRINETPFVVVGVTGEAFRGVSTGGRFTPLTDLTVPLSMQPLVWNRAAEPQSQPDMFWVRLMLRLEDDADERAVSAGLTAALRGSLVETGVAQAAQAPEIDVVLRPGTRGLDSLSRRAGRPMLVLSAVAVVVLLIASLNLAGLMLARGVARQREMAIRRALGAGRRRLFRQVLTESGVLAVLGAACGVGLFAWVTPVISAMMATGLGAEAVELPLDASTLVVTTLVTGVALVLSGVLPAVRWSRTPDATFLRQPVLGASSSRPTAGRILLAVQIGVSVPLVVTASLLLQTLQNLEQVELGFNPENLTVFRIDPSRGRPMEPAAVELFYTQFLDDLEAIPGVQSATLIENVLTTGWISNTVATVDGEQHRIHMNAVGPSYFETLEIPLIAGRAIGPRDGRSASRVVVVNEKAAREIFGDEAPLGRRFNYGRTEAEIVGVVADTRYAAVRDDVPPTLFDPIFQRGRAAANVVVRTTGPLPALEQTVHAVLAASGVDLPVADIRRQTDYVAENIGRERLVTRLLGSFGGFAILLACIGLYGVTAYSVERRTNEMGIRLALGARRSQILWLVLRQVLRLAAAGLVIGVPVALAVSPLVGSFLYGVGPRDPVTVGLASSGMLLVSIGAGWPPARRAARLEALTALRRE